MKQAIKIPQRNQIFYFLYLLLILYLVLTNKTFKRMANEPVIALMGFQLLITFLYTGFWKVAFSRYFIFIYLSVFMYAFYYVIGHDKASIINIPIIVRNIPLFVLGFFLILDHPRKQLLILCYLISHSLIVLVDIYRIKSYSSAGLFKEEMAVIINYSDMSFYASKNDLIPWFPSLSFLVLLSFIIWHNSNKLTLICVIGCQLILTYQVAISGWVSSILLLGLGLVLYTNLRIIKSGKQFLRNMVVFACVMGIGLFAYSILSSQKGGHVGSASKRIDRLIDGISQGNVDAIDDVSGGRITLAKFSLNEFYKNPLIGTGNNYIGGGHSHIFDTLGRFGIIGSIAISGQLFFWLYLSFLNYRKFPMNNTVVVCFSIMILFFIGNIINPYYPKTYIDSIVFFAGGMICGLDYLQRKGMKMINDLGIHNT